MIDDAHCILQLKTWKMQQKLARSSMEWVVRRGRIGYKKKKKYFKFADMKKWDKKVKQWVEPHDGKELIAFEIEII